MRTNQDHMDSWCFVDKNGNALPRKDCQFVEWFNIENNAPPKDKPFLVLTSEGVEIMEWKSVIGNKNSGWFRFQATCNCCRGHCSNEFKYWMELPDFPN